MGISLDIVNCCTQSACLFCDTYAAAGPVSEGFFARPNVHSPGVSAGRTKQAFVLLSEKVLANLKKALDGSEETLQRL